MIDELCVMDNGSLARCLTTRWDERPRLLAQYGMSEGDLVYWKQLATRRDDSAEDSGDDDGE